MTQLEATAFIPGAIAAFVGVTELRSNVSRADKTRNVVAVILALVLVTVFFLLERVIDVTSPYTRWLAYVMTGLACIVGISGALLRYSRRANSILMALAGFMLAYYWAFFSLPRP
jgi:uncharacterized membrane protein